MIISQVSYPIHIAARFGFTKATEKLIEKKANVLALDDDKNLALHIAARSGHAPLIEPLVKAGTDVNRTFLTFQLITYL